MRPYYGHPQACTCVDCQAGVVKPKPRKSAGPGLKWVICSACEGYGRGGVLARGLGECQGCYKEGWQERPKTEKDLKVEGLLEPLPETRPESSTACASQEPHRRRETPAMKDARLRMEEPVPKPSPPSTRHQADSGRRRVTWAEWFVSRLVNLIRKVARPKES